MRGTLHQEWLLAPFLVPATSHPLKDSKSVKSEDTVLFKVLDARGRMQEHYSSIRRIRSLAEKHPMVLSVEPHNIQKAADPSTFDVNGRATKYHQSPYNLQIVLKGGPSAPSGMTFHMGLTVNDTNRNLMSLWWTPGKEATQAWIDDARQVFHDITESHVGYVPPAASGAASQPQPLARAPAATSRSQLLAQHLAPVSSGAASSLGEGTASMVFAPQQGQVRDTYLQRVEKDKDDARQQERQQRDQAYNERRDTIGRGTQGWWWEQLRRAEVLRFN